MVRPLLSPPQRLWKYIVKIKSVIVPYNGPPEAVDYIQLVKYDTLYLWYCFCVGAYAQQQLYYLFSRILWGFYCVRGIHTLLCYFPLPYH